MDNLSNCLDFLLTPEKKKKNFSGVDNCLNCHSHLSFTIRTLNKYRLYNYLKGDCLVENSPLRGHALTGNECYTDSQCPDLIVEMLFVIEIDNEYFECFWNLWKFCSVPLLRDRV